MLRMEERESVVVVVVEVISGAGMDGMLVYWISWRRNFVLIIDENCVQYVHVIFGERRGEKLRKARLRLYAFSFTTYLICRW